MKIYHQLSVFIIHLLVIQFPGACDGSATLQINMISFRNDANTDSAGSSCDIFWGTCDTFFKFCIDRYSTSYSSHHDMAQCSIFQGQTGEFADTKNIDFSHDMNGIQNPIEKRFPIWNGGIVLKVEVWDDDSGHSGHDLIDKEIQLVWNQRPAKTKSASYYDTKLLRGKHGKSLTVQVRAWCDDLYYGPKCEVMCVPRNDVTGHYTCDSETGDKICISGWESPADDCTIWADDCDNNKCQNGATCRDGHRSYSCVCPPGFTGSYCETNIDECSSDPCQNNGTCIDGINGYTCSCSGHFVGNNCEKEACDHMDPCQNGGTCYKDRKCLCPVGYRGKFCEINKCKEVNCTNGGTCYEGICTCPKGFVGALCRVAACSIKRCHNNGTCHLGECNCTGTGYTGASCHIKINYCETLPCGSRGECVNDLLSYHCLCYYGYSGINCENVVSTTAKTEISDGTTWFEEVFIPNTEKPILQDDRNVLDKTKQNEPIIAAKQGKDSDSKPKDMMMYYIIGGVVGGLILFLLLLIIAIALYRRKRSKPKEEDPYDTLSVPPSSMGDFQNPLYGHAEPIEEDSVDTRTASTNTEPHYATPHPRAQTDGASSLPVSPPSYTESQLAAIAVAHGDNDIKKTKLDSISDNDNDENEYDDVFNEDKNYVKVPID